jgi:hypothetical protein
MKIFGQILDIDNSVLAYANVILNTEDVSTKIGTYSDLDGNFELNSDDINADSQFKITHVGYSSQYFKSTELQGKKIKLIEDDFQLDEIIVTEGLGEPNNNVQENKNIKGDFVGHLQKHRFIYGGLGAIAGVFLILRGYKKFNK